MSSKLSRLPPPECVRTIEVPELARAGWLQKPLLNAQLFTEVAGIARPTFDLHRQSPSTRGHGSGVPPR